MNTQSIFDYEVYDRNNEKVGKVENVWADSNEQVGYLGISTGWLGLGQNHLIPGRGITIDQRTKTVHVPYDEDTIKSSSSYDLTTELTDIEEGRLNQHYGVESSCGCETPAQASRSTEKGKQVEVPLAEEKLHVGKREVSLGEVRLRKVVRTEQVSQPVELRHEEVVVERVSGQGRKPGEKAFVEEVISIPVKKEEAVIQKTVESAGAVKATKKATSTQERVTETLRKEDVEIDRELAGARRD